MTTKVSPYLRFNDLKCREAFGFYKDCFGGGEIQLMTVGDSPMAKDMPPGSGDRIMHAVFKKGDMQLLGSDMMRDKAVVGDNVSVMVEFDNEKELNTVFDKMAKGGEVFMKPEEMFWGGVFGTLTDKYGIEWSYHFQKRPMKT
jgi:PhnB protein